jgi:hypothetical protein
VLDDAASSRLQYLDGIQFGEIEVSGSCGSLAHLVARQQRLTGLRLQDLKFDIATIIEEQRGLKRLCLHRCNQGSYEYLSRLSKLEVLSLAYLKGFPDLGCLRTLLRLRALGIESQKNLNGYDLLSELKSLEFIGFTNLGSISSIKWMQNLDHLKIVRVLGDCKILDGDLQFLSAHRSIVSCLIDYRKIYNFDPGSISKLSQTETNELLSQMGIRF